MPIVRLATGAQLARRRQGRMLALLVGSSPCLLTLLQDDLAPPVCLQLRAAATVWVATMAEATTRLPIAPACAAAAFFARPVQRLASKISALLEVSALRAPPPPRRARQEDTETAQGSHRPRVLACAMRAGLAPAAKSQQTAQICARPAFFAQVRHLPFPLTQLCAAGADHATPW